MQLLGTFLYFLFVLILFNTQRRNAIKLIISILALTKGQIAIIKTSLIGSILLNLLLILSIYFFFKGINSIKQYFNIMVVNTTASLLALCVSSLIILTAFYSTLLSKFNNSFRPIVDTNLYTYIATSPNSSILNQKLSYGTAIILLIVYIYYLIF